MPEARSDFLREIETRGYLHQCTDPEGLDALAAAGRIAAYIGFDCTADSLHVGSLVPIMMLRWLQRCGHKPIVLMGGGTTKIGDPSGKDEARQLLDETQIRQNMANQPQHLRAEAAVLLAEGQIARAQTTAQAALASLSAQMPTGVQQAEAAWLQAIINQV